MPTLDIFIKLLDALSSYVWPAIFIGLVILFHSSITNLIAALNNQIKSGATVKYGDLELTGIKLENFELARGATYEKVAADETLSKHRADLRKNQRGIFLVHRVQATDEVRKDKGFKLYDMSIYLVSHKGFGRLNDIDFVEYQFGESRDAQFPHGTRYVVRNSQGGFAVRRLGSGPTYCAARINFHDGHSVVVDRYLDFEGTGFEFDPNAFPQGVGPLE